MDLVQDIWIISRHCLESMTSVQEHWLLPQQFHVYNTSIPDCYSHCVSAMTGSELLMGCPFGGCAVIWNKNIQGTVTPIQTDCSRICAKNLVLNNLSIFICSVYMPTESASHLDEFKDTLHELNALLNCSQYDAIVIGGDFNTSFERKSKNLHVVKDFMSNETLKCGLFYYKVNVQYTFESKIDGKKSLIDPIFFLVKIFLTISLLITLIILLKICQIISQCVYSLMLP